MNYIALNFPPPPPEENEDYFPPPPPDALGLPPKQSHGSLDEIEVCSHENMTRNPSKFLLSNFQNL